VIICVGDRELEECTLELMGRLVSNLSVALSPNEEDLERFEIATSQILCRHIVK
jgi:hypothetical protein